MITYPRTVKYDKDKLAAVYRMVEQMRLEYNKVSASKPAADKFRTYEREQFRPRLKALLAEQNRLKEQIRLDSKIDWSKLTEEEQPTVELQLFGDKSTLKTQETDATSPLLDELKAIKLDSLEDTKDADPTEDFTGYTEVDVGADRLTVTASKITVTDLDLDETCIVYKDKGAAHFDGDFEHRFKTLCSAITNSGFFYPWMMANIIGDARDVIDQSEDSHGVLWRAWYDGPKLYLLERDSGTAYSDNGSVNTSTVYYITVERDESTGTYGTIYAYICTGNYNGESGSSLVDTLTVALHTSKKDFRYIYGVASSDQGNGGNAISGYTEDLDLQEAVAGWSNIAKVNGVTATDLAEVDGIAVASIAKINGVAV